MASKFDIGLASEVRIQKVGPYTITPIGGPAEYKAWKQKQLDKEQLWMEQADARYNLKKSSALAILNGDKQATPDYAESIQKRFKEGQERQAALYAEACKQQLLTPPNEKKSVISTIKNFFLNVNFGPKK